MRKLGADGKEQRGLKAITLADIVDYTSPLLRKIHDERLAVDTAQWDVQNIPGNPGDTLMIEATLRVSVSSELVWMRFNNDTGGNYAYTTNSSDASSSVDTVGTKFLLVQASDGIEGSASGAGQASILTATIPNYAGTDFHKGYQSLITHKGTRDGTHRSRGRWANTAAITRIAILPASGNFVAGSRLTIWRRAVA